MSEILEGGCHCRGIRYAVTGAIRHSSYCHCRICQTTMGSPVGIFASVMADGFRYTAGVPKVYRSSDRVVREFCGNCGAQIVYRPDGKPHLAFSVVTLDDPSKIEPTLHIFTESRIPWFDTADAHPRRPKVHD